MNPYIFGICDTRERLKYIYIAMLLPALKRKEKKRYFGRQTLGATDLKFGIHTLLDLQKTCGYPTWQHIFFLMCKVKNITNGTSENAWTLGIIHTNLHIFEISVIRRTFKVYLYNQTPSCLIVKPKKKLNVLLTIAMKDTSTYRPKFSTHSMALGVTWAAFHLDIPLHFGVSG